MAAVLTYHPRRALLEATAGGRRFLLPIHHDDSRVTAWEHRFEIRPGRYAVWNHAYVLRRPRPSGSANVPYTIATQQSALEVYDYPGGYAPRFDGVDKGGDDAPHSHPGRSVYVGPRIGGIYLHALPVCNLKTCIIVLHQWEDLRRAMTGEADLSFFLAG
jgi:hypothetical protein